MATYQVEIVEPASGQLRSVYLYEGIQSDEVKLLFDATFGIDGTIVGFTDDRKISYPFSMISRSPKLFDGRCLTLILENNAASCGQHSNIATSESDELILTDENAEKAFNILDKNGDGYLHKEEMVEVLTVAYSKFMDLHTRYSFAYSCLTPRDVAAATAQNCLDSVTTADGDYCLDFDDFCAWYLSAGTNALRELMVMSIESISSTGSIFGPDSPQMKRTKSRTSLELGDAYSDRRVANFVSSCQNLLRLSSGSLTYLLDLIGVSAKGRSVISHDLYTKIFYVYLLQHNHQLTEQDTDIVRVLDVIFDILSSDANDKVHLLELGSLLCTVTNGKYLQSLKTLFDMYPESHTGFVSESILMNHLCQILRIVFYFNPRISKATSCFPEDLACALSVKVFLLIESKRKCRGKLNLEEFVETFLHGLMMGLSQLQIGEGFFCEYLERLMSYIDNGPARSPVSAQGKGTEAGVGRRRVAEELEEEVEGEDVESYADDSEDYAQVHDLRDGVGQSDSDSSDGDGDSGESSSGGGDADGDTDAARITSVREEDTLEDLPEDEEDGQEGEDDDRSGSQVLLEDSQVSAQDILYEGAAISVLEARQFMGLLEFSSRVVCQYILQELADERGNIGQALYFKGLSRLIGDVYNSSTVLLRSKIDFVLHRLFAVFDPDGSGVCNAAELGCGLLLFCGDDALVRSRVAWELLEADTAYGNMLNFDAIVRSVSALIKAQLSLDPYLDINAFLSAVEVRAHLETITFFPSQQLSSIISHSASDFVELFSCTLFMCQSEAMDLELEKYDAHQKKPDLRSPNGSFRSPGTKSPNGSFRTNKSPPNNGSFHSAAGRAQFNDSSVEGDEDGEQDFGVQVADDIDLGSSTEDEDDDGPNSFSGMGLTLGTFSHDNDDEVEENVYTNDKHFPPSAVVLELRAARAILGLENYSADELMATLAEHSPGGKLSESGWLRWLSYITHKARTPEQDLDIAIHLGNRLFEAFDSSAIQGSPVKGKALPHDSQIPYERMTAGLAFLCGGSPLEERLMVAFTVMDGDSDGCITQAELIDIINSALIVISVCSRMVADKVILLGAPLSELAEAAAIEAVTALNVDDTAAYISLEMLCEMSDDFLKLAALF